LGLTHREGTVDIVNGSDFSFGSERTFLGLRDSAAAFLDASAAGRVRAALAAATYLDCERRSFSQQGLSPQADLQTERIELPTSVPAVTAARFSYNVTLKDGTHARRIEDIVTLWVGKYSASIEFVGIDQGVDSSLEARVVAAVQARLNR